MRRLQSSIAEECLHTGEVVTVDPDVPNGCASVSYEISGFDTIVNPVAKRLNGRRIRQTSLPIVFESGLGTAAPDGVSVEAVLAVCSDHLNTRQRTPDANKANEQAEALIRKAMVLLSQQQQRQMA